MGIVCIRSPDRLAGGLTCIGQNRAVRQYRRPRLTALRAIGSAAAAELRSVATWRGEG
jgi:hypothetical protein